MAVRLTIDNARMENVVGRLTRGAMARGARVARQRASRNAPVDRGHLAGSIASTPAQSIGYMQWQVQVFSNLHYAIYQERGTRGSVARPGRMLRFKPKGSSTYVFAKRTGPVPATRFMERALNSLTSADFF